MFTIGSTSNGQVERRAPLYVPVLKGRRGEFSALEMMNPLTRSMTYPLIEVVPDVEIAPLRPGALMTTFAHLALRWMGPIMLDGFHLSPQLGAGATVVRAVTDAARGLLQAVPVVRLTDGEDALRDAAAVASEDGNGIAIRLTADFLSADPRQVSLDVQELVEAVRVPLDAVDVLVDLGLVESRVAVAWAGIRADNLLAQFSRVADFRTVIVASGAFPVDLRDVVPWSVTERARHDAAAWEHLVARDPIRVPVFGDYAIAHPRMLPPNSGFPSPSCGTPWRIDGSCSGVRRTIGGRIRSSMRSVKRSAGIPNSAARSWGKRINGSRTQRQRDRETRAPGGPSARHTMPTSWSLGF